jgi:peroxiredoxin
VILDFYPANSTPVFATQPCDYRNTLSSHFGHAFNALGISKDEAQPLEECAGEENLTCPLNDETLMTHQLLEGSVRNASSASRPTRGGPTLAISKKDLALRALYDVRVSEQAAILRTRFGIN